MAIIGNPTRRGVQQTVKDLVQYLSETKRHVLLEPRLQNTVEMPITNIFSISQLAKHADLAIVIGGDGSLLRIARLFTGSSTAIIGMNLGNLGFLADLSPVDYRVILGQMLAGDYQVEERFLLEGCVINQHGECKEKYKALNEIVLHPNKIAHMISFEVSIDNQFMYSQRADGMIVATPTGSTAYALSAGGPILSPGIDALNIIPMFPHTLNNRPIVVQGSSQVTLNPSPERNHKPLRVSFDSQHTLSLKANDKLLIRKHPDTLHVLHPRGYSFFHILRNKLGWGSKLF